MIPNTRGADAALRRARHLLLECGELPAGLIDAAVERSWRRCFSAGLAPVGRLAETPHLSSFELARAADLQQELIAHARPVMEYVHTQTRDSGSMVILADARGVLLQALGDADFLGRAERVALMPGASWHERYRGTNAIGTALAEAGPVVVHGAEHYLERNGFLTCAAATVTAPDGRLLGVLDISGDHKSRHPHTFGLVRAAAQMIENRLFEARHGAGIRLRFHPLAEGIGTVAEGVAALSEDGWLLGANQAGLALLGLAAPDLGTTPLARLFDLRLEDLIDWGMRRHGQPLLVVRPDGGRLFVRVEPGRRPLAGDRQRLQPPPADALSALDSGDEKLRNAVERTRRVLGKPIALLIQGESGVGKEGYARAAHDTGPRRDKPFVVVNCAALAENRVEAELFGDAPGHIRAAQGGTLFLDEIGDMPAAAQRRLLQVLQERRVTVPGGRPVTVDFALICASRCNLKADVEAGRFRADLYYRINGLALTLPPLCERSDLQALIARMIEAAAPGRGIALEPAVAAAFADYAWPGNQRQLANALHAACALLDDEETRIGWQHLPEDLAQELRMQPQSRPEPEIAPAQSLRSLSAAAIRQAVAAAQGNISEAARRLGISRNTLYRQLKRMPLG